ncbi:MAG TPA: GatB/YqeY domain-containing protein [Bacteroidales bacterium]|nr:GatB/YqeY domain-containing protein [Bacteroidales bacterium]HOR60383.1 GatB/YqeY domain-containing protein [Bacteroidales bacterium]HPL04649.1 GatB/YqeY domain-containing protein [Bacteroidales bacterium]
MSILDRINEDIKKAMLAKEKEKLEALRAVKAAFLLAKTEAGASEELAYEKELQIIQKLIKQRRDAAEIYKQQNRMDLYEPEEFQAEIISQYLPAQLSEEELRLEISKIIQETGASSIKDMGKVMGIANSKLVGKADSKSISGIVKQLLTS